MSNERKYNTSRYKYTGPDVKVHTKRYFYGFGYCQNSIFLCNEAIVIAEVNINVATVIGIVIHDEDYDIDPIYIAAKYLESVKPEPTHFDPKDDVDVPHFFDNLFSDIVKMQSEFGKIFNENFTQEPSKETLDNLRKYAREYKDNIEVGGQHYQTAIQPWDFIYANHIPFDESCIIKYACRHKKKGGVEDVKKIISYAKHILKTQYGIDYGKDNE